VIRHRLHSREVAALLDLTLTLHAADLLFAEVSNSLLELIERKPKGAGSVDEPVVVAGERESLS
jgi:hypothetical protein